MRIVIRIMPKLSSHPRVVGSALAIDGKRTKYSVEGVPGLVLDCTPDGLRTWYVRYQVGHGRNNRVMRYHRLGSFSSGQPDYLSLGQAKDRVAAVRTDAKRDGKDAFADARSSCKGATFDDLFLRWLERHSKRHKRSWRQDESRYRIHLQKRIGAIVAADLKRRDIIRALDAIADCVSGVTANRCQAVISAVLSWAMDEDLIEHSPAHGIRKRGQEVPRERVLSFTELRAFWNSLGDTQMDSAVKLLLLLGQRRNETGGAKAHEFRVDGWHLPGERTKNGLPHLVPLTDNARRLFGSGFNFDPSRLSHRVQRIVCDLGIEDFRLHDLRHCVATGMAALGIPREVRERIQNQVTGRRMSVAARYDQYDYLDEKRRALELWERQLTSIVEKGMNTGERW